MNGRAMGRWGAFLLVTSAVAGVARAQEGEPPAPGEETAPSGTPEPAVGEEATPPEAAASPAPGDAAPAEPAPAASPAEAQPPLALDLPGSMRLRIGGQIRWRGEYRGDTYVQPRTNSSTDFALQRLRLSFDLDVQAWLAARVVIQDSRRWGDKGDGLAGTRLDSDQPELMLYEGYAELREPWDQPVRLKVGRMALPRLGDQRLISDLDWSNVARSWDGAQFVWEPEGWWFTAFAANIREGGALTPAGDESDDTWFVGGYASNRMVPAHEFDAFIFWRHIGERVFTSATGVGNRDDVTLGLRAKGGAGPLTWNGTLAYQTGDQASDPIDAWAAAAELALSIPVGEEAKFNVSSEYSFASGDGDPSDGRVRTFDPLFPFGHFYLGHQDLFAWRNLHSVNLRLALVPWKGFSLHADTHVFFLDRRDDRWYGIGFTRNDAGRVADDSYMGTELDLYAKLAVLDSHLSFWGGYSHFFPGGWIRDTGSKTSGQDWVFLMATVDF